MITDKYAKLYWEHIQHLSREKLIEVRDDKEWEIKEINKLLFSKAFHSEERQKKVNK